MERNHTAGTDGKPAGCSETGARTASGCHGNRGTWRVERTRASLPLPRFEHAPIDMSAWPKGRAGREETLYFCVRAANFHKKKKCRHKPKCVKGCVRRRGWVNTLIMLKTQRDTKLCASLIPSPFVSRKYFLKPRSHHIAETRCSFQRIARRCLSEPLLGYISVPGCQLS